ncbi:ankyrin-1 [Cucurbita maxima]|uniref:Ankyrin-1 n=1 Tax=Cucurbita maxima TaxID=3661 RepID=A0A6J1JRK4_CUCMA|nr:ankyrin-1 [Cucurbita maxima]
MTVFSGKQVFPLNFEAEVSQRLIEASHSGDLKSALDCISNPCVDVNFVGAVHLKNRKTELVLSDESASQVRVEYDEFKTDVTALFVAVHTGNVVLVKKLLGVGADVNQKLFRGFATTAAVREGHLEILEILLKAGASQPACEEALLESSCHGHARSAELLMGSDLVRPHIAVHALVTACCRGFVDVVDTLLKCGVDANATARVLLQSSKPSLHTNVNCTALVAAVVSRKISIVRFLLQAGARIDISVRLGAWSWDMDTGEEFRVGAGLAEPYDVTWCAVEYFEGSGAILRMLLQHTSPNVLHYGRTLIHHAILCGNAAAVDVLSKCGADVEFPVKATGNAEFRPLHMAARLGMSAVMKCLIDAGCDLNTKTDSGDTALMICAKHKYEECLKVLGAAGADFGLVNVAGQSVCSIAGSNQWSLGFQRTVTDLIKSGKRPISSNMSVFCPLILAAQSGDTEALKVLIGWGGYDLDYQDDHGFTAAMVAASNGHAEAFRLLVYAGADVRLSNKSGETAITLYQLHPNHDQFEKVMLEFALDMGSRNAAGFYALHCAARRGDLDAVKFLTNKSFDVNVVDSDGYTPLMLAARGGHGSVCKLLLSHGAHADIRSPRGETALSLARKNKKSEAEEVILDELARGLTLHGAHVKKHTRGGKGSPHGKELRMIGSMGMLQWGKSSRRNVVCRDVEVGSSPRFMKNRLKKGDGSEPGLFRIVTVKNKEVHFVCEGGSEMAELWVRGIKLVTKEAMKIGCI